MDTATCAKCGLERPTGDFYTKRSAKSGRASRCKSCELTQKRDEYRADGAARRQKARDSFASGSRAVTRARNAAWLLEYLSSRPCVACGEGDPVVLDLDHIRGNKRASVANMVNGHSLAAIQAEVEKCQVLCANCHRKKTVIERGWFNRSIVRVAS